MAVQREIKTIFAIDGEQKYSDAIKGINKQQTLLKAELNASTAAFDAAGDKQGKLRAQAESLAKQIDLQKRIINESKNAVEQATTKYGENATTTQELKIQYLNAEAALSKLQSKLISSTKDLALQESKLKAVGEAAEKVGKGMSVAGDKMGKVGTAMTMGVTAPIVAVGAGLVSLVQKTTDAADKLQQMSDVTGIGTEQLQELQYVGAKADVELETMTGSMRKLTKSMGAAEIGEAAVDTKKLGDAQATAAKATIDVESAQIKLNTAINKYGANSDQAKLATNALEKAQLNLGDANEEVTLYTEAQAGKVNAQGEAFKRLGISIKNSDGSLRDAKVVWAEAIEALGKVANETERDTISMTLFGKSAMDLNPLIKAGSKEIANLTAEAHKNGAVMSKESVEAMDKFSDSLATARLSLGAAAGEIVVELLPTLNKLLPVVQKDIVPAIKKAAELIGDLAEKFGKLNPKQQENVLKMIALAAAAGPVLKVTGALTSTVGGATQGIGKFITKLAEKKAAEAAATVATTGLTSAMGSGSGLLATLGPVGLAIGAVALTAGGLYLAYQESTRSAREAGKAGEEFARGIANWHDDVSAAKSALEGFNQETIISAERMSEFDAGISNAQGKIIELAEKAAGESRKYTDAEQAEIQKLIGQINDYTQKKIDAYQAQAEVVAAMATRERDVTFERANELIKGAEDAREQTLAIAQARYADQVGEAEKLYGHLGTLDKTRYDELLASGEDEKNAQVDAANKTHGETLAIIQKKYADYNAEDMIHLARLAELANEYGTLEQQKTDKLTEMTTERKKQLKEDTISAVEEGKLRYDAESWYSGEKSRINDELKAEYGELGQANLDNWIGMVANTQLYGGQVDTETTNLINGVIASFNLLPQKSKDAALNSMQGLYDGMKEKEPSLFEKAKGIANTIIGTFNRIFDNNSPSRAFRKMGRQNDEGLALGLEDGKKDVITKAGSVADGVISEASRISDTQAYLNLRLQQTGLGRRIDASGPATAALIAATPSAAAQSLAPGVGKMVHSGELRVVGVNDQGETVGATKIIMDQLRMEYMLSGL